MLILSKDNIIAYLSEHYPKFITTGTVSVSAIGDPDGEVPADGFVNYIFKIKNEAQSIIAKQSREEARALSKGTKLPPDRNRLEYETLKLRSAIVPQYVPEIYAVDLKNHIFLMEDISFLPASGHLFRQGGMPAHFGKRCAEFVASTVFYTSEFYLETEQFRDLRKTFTNTPMRRIMEQGVFLRKSSFPQNPLCTDLAQYVDGDPAVVAQCYLLRHKFMTHTEALIHADFHTANIFADDTRLKVIDMEYTFAGPYSYDIGYLMDYLISQYCSAVFRPFASEGDRVVFKKYMLGVIYELYTEFIAYVNLYWERDAKEIYRNQSVFKQLLADEFLGDVVGYSAIPGLSRALNSPTFPEFEMIEDADLRRNALRLFVITQRHLLLNRSSYRAIDQVISNIVEIEATFRKRLS